MRGQATAGSTSVGPRRVGGMESWKEKDGLRERERGRPLADREELMSLIRGREAQVRVRGLVG